MNERTNGKTEIENGSECVERGGGKQKGKKKTTSQDHSRAMHGAKH